MSKWIAEFELEDGDKMPEHMDLEYHGVKFDFHCRPIGKTYEDGLNDAWECAKNLLKGEYDQYKRFEIFGNTDVDNIFTLLTGAEALVKLKKYEEEQKNSAEIKIGDEVTDDDGWNGVVTWIDPDGEYLIILQKDGTALRWKKDIFKKTGRHFPEIEKVLKQIQEG